MHSISDSPPPSPSTDQSIVLLDNTDVASGNENNESHNSDDGAFVTPEKNENPTITAAEIVKGNHLTHCKNYFYFKNMFKT